MFDWCECLLTAWQECDHEKSSKGAARGYLPNPAGLQRLPCQVLLQDAMHLTEVCTRACKDFALEVSKSSSWDSAITPLWLYIGKLALGLTQPIQYGASTLLGSFQAWDHGHDSTNCILAMNWSYLKAFLSFMPYTHIVVIGPTCREGGCLGCSAHSGYI